MSLASNINDKVGLVYTIVDKLIGVYKLHEYGEIILPRTVIRSFYCGLVDTRDGALIYGK